MKILFLTTIFSVMLPAQQVVAQVAQPVENTQGLIEEIVVTAEFRATTLDTLAGSASVIKLQDAGTVVNHLEEVLAQAPNVNFASGASRGRYIQIRGIGERSQFDEPLNSSVGLIVDGVDLSGVGAAATLFDVQQVEVLRGPQGTLYGANALAGLINVVTPPPSQTLTSSVRLDAGDYGALGLGAVVSGPLTEEIGFRLSAQRYRDDGFIDNNFQGRENTDNHDERSVRAKLVWGAGASDWKLSLGYVDVNNGYDAFSLDNDRNTLSDEPGFDEQETAYAALSVNWMLTDGLLFEGSLASARSDVDYGYDEDWTFAGFPDGYSSTDRYIRERTTTTLEGRLLSQPGAGLWNGAWDWVVGVFALQQDVDLERQYTFSGISSSDFSMDRTAVYGELSGQLAAQWRLTLGARYERHEADYDDTQGVDLSPDNNLVGGRVLLEYDMEDGGLLYAGVSRGYNAGGFNVDGTLPVDLIEYDDETLLNYELGYKTRLLDQRLALRAALFYMQRDDIQIATSVTRPIGIGDAVEFIQFRGNATEGFNQGLELESHFQVNDQLALFANLGLLDTEYDRYVNGEGVVAPSREQAQAPSYQFFAGLEYDFTERWSLRLELEGKDEFFFSDTHNVESDAYELWNASLTYRADRWQARLWGRNLSDEDYFVRGFFFGNDPRDGYTDRAFTQLGEPRQIGISLSADF
ncbi:MAG: TonB-dependent receptor [Pseudomonadota bacterium]